MQIPRGLSQGRTNVNRHQSWFGSPVGDVMKVCDPGPREYCQWEDFSAECPDGEMLLMKNGIYGRMRIGRCVKNDFGYIGCGSDVLDQLHELCSGRQSCSFPVTNLHGTQGEGTDACPLINDLSPYLAATYECVKVVSCETSMCQTSDYLRVSSGKGYLSSDVTQKSGCGSTSCPWVLEAEPGQQINISLLDFSRGKSFDKDTSEPGKICYRYATIKEEESVNKDITICSGQDMMTETPIYLSTSEKVSVSLYTSSDPEEQFHFALKYKVLGCPEFKPPKGGSAKRTGDELKVHCNQAGNTWTLHCSGNSWVGEVGPCEYDSWSITTIGDEDANSTFGMFVVIGLGVAIGIVVGGIFLAFALLYLKRRRRPNVRTEHTLLGEHAIYAERGVRYNGQGISEENFKNAMVVSMKQGPYIQEHDYTSTLHARQPLRKIACGQAFDPRAPARRHGSQSSHYDDTLVEIDDGRSREIQHVYETPMFPDDKDLKGIRTQSADGISRKVEHDEGKSNRTS